MCVCDRGVHVCVRVCARMTGERVCVCDRRACVRACVCARDGGRACVRDGG